MEEEIKAVDAVETETTPESAPENETTVEVEKTESDTSAQTTEDVEKPKSRAQERIQQLNRELKDAQEKASYWDALVAKTQAPRNEAPSGDAQDDDGEITVDQIADAVLQRQTAQKQQEMMIGAADAIQRDLVATLEAHPELAEDDDLAEIVVQMAQAKKITLQAAADRVKSRLKAQEAVGATKKTAEEAARMGAASTQGAKVSSGTTSKPNILKMTKEEEAQRWGEIVEAYASKGE